MWGEVKKLLRPLRQDCNVTICLSVVYYPWRIQHIRQMNLRGKRLSRDIKLTGQIIRHISI